MQQDAAEQISTGSTEPYPPRFWWLKQLTACGIGLILLLVGLRIWWGYEAHKRLTTEIAAIQARGEPIFPEDFQPPTIPDAENAAYYLKQAAAAISPLADSPTATATEYPAYFPYPSEWHVVADKAITINRSSLDYARQARNYDKADWGIKFQSPVIAIMFPNFMDQRHLAILLADAAVHAHLNGDDAAAMEYIRDLLFISRMLDLQPGLISHLVSNGIDFLATHRVRLIAPGLMIVDASLTSASLSIYSATRAQIQTIINDLLNDQPQRDGMYRALLAERMILLDLVRWKTKNSKLLRPMFDLDALRVIRTNDALMRTAGQLNWPSAKAANPANSNPSSNQRFQFSHMMSNFFLEGDSLTRAIQINFGTIAERRMAAISLAARLYQIDHNGNWPPTLEALVPEYLPAVPIDPLAGDGRALGYILARGGTRPVVYSVGENGSDDTPDESVLPPEPSYGWPNGLDQWRDLSRWVPAPTTAPADDAASGEIGRQ